MDNKANYSASLGENFETTSIVGMQGYITRREVTSTEGVDFPGPGFNVASAASQIETSEEFKEVTELGVFAQEQVGYKDFLFVTLGARYDANSAFGEDFTGVVYPKASLSVVPSDAEFLTFPAGPISSLRLRAAIGQSGLQPGAFDALTTYGPLSPAGGAGFAPENLGNPDLKPEVATEWELGTELGLFGERVGAELTYWNRNVNDALVERQFAPAGGFRNLQLVNVGEIKGQGLEIGLDAGIVNRDNLTVDLFANAAYLWEKLTDLGGAPPIKAGGSYPRPRNYLVEGYAPGANFGASLMDVPEGHLPLDFNGDGQPDTREEVLSHLQGLTPATARLPESTGIVLLAQEGGHPDLNAPLDQYKGKPFPDWSGSFGFDVGFLNGFNLSSMFEYKAGNYYVNHLSGAFAKRSATIGRNTPTAARTWRDYLTGGVDENYNPQNDPQVRMQALETWLDELLGLAPFSGLNHIEKADFVRWRELSLTYNAPDEWVSRINVQSLSLTFGVRNVGLWTPTGYSGFEPEAQETGVGGTSNNIDQNFRTGIEAWQTPIPRRYSLRLRIGF